MPTLRSLWLLIILASSNGNVKSAPFLVVAFTTSIPASRFASIRTREHVLFSMQDKGRPTLTPEKIESFRAGIEALELPPPPFSFTRAMADMAVKVRHSRTFGTPLLGAPPCDATSHDTLPTGVATLDETETLKKDLVVVASQINACEASVTAEQRELVHSFLSIAQLAARRHPHPATRSEAFLDVLLNNGWLQLGTTESATKTLALNATMNDQIVPILTKAFAAIPGHTVVVAATKIVNILQGLDTTAPPSSWIRLYHKYSKRQHGADFQFSTTSIDADKTIVLDLVNVDFNAGHTITQVLFFTFTTADATLEITKRKLSITPGLLESLGPVLRKRVRPFIPSEVMSIEN